MAALRYPPAKISVDPATPKAAVDKYKADGMSLIFSDEFKDLARTKAMFVFDGIDPPDLPTSPLSQTYLYSYIHVYIITYIYIYTNISIYVNSSSNLHS